MAAKLHHLSACVQEHSCPVLLPCSVLPCPGLPCLFLLLQPLAKFILYQETHTCSQLLHLTVTKHTLCSITSHSTKQPDSSSQSVYAMHTVLEHKSCMHDVVLH